MLTLFLSIVISLIKPEIRSSFKTFLSPKSAENGIFTAKNSLKQHRVTMEQKNVLEECRILVTPMQQNSRRINYARKLLAK
jgi:hypothetical protein